MKDFAAIDFETANNERSSVCSVGIVIVRNGEIVDKFYSLIKPEPEYYTYWCSRVHGLSAADTQDAPVFHDVWKQIEPKIAGLPLVAHNKAFDESCLKAVFRVYQMPWPSYPFFCTCVASMASRSAHPRCHRRPLRLRFNAPPPRPGRRRSLCRHCVEDIVTCCSPLSAPVIRKRK